MSNSKIQFRLPADRKDAAMRQAAEPGISVNLFDTTVVAARVGARAEAERYFTAPGSRTTPALAMTLLMRLGTPGSVREGDKLNAPDEPA